MAFELIGSMGDDSVLVADIEVSPDLSASVDGRAQRWKKPDRVTKWNCLWRTFTIPLAQSAPQSIEKAAKDDVALVVKLKTHSAISHQCHVQFAM
jgi:hypothetical protein